jgi:hypothetical protein
MLRRRRRLMPGLRLLFFTLLILFIAQFISLGISVKRASRDEQLSTTTMKSNKPFALLKHTERHGPAVGVTPVFIPV